MPRPRPLTHISSSSASYIAHELTPRTPRTSRLEQGFSNVALAEAEDLEYDDTTFQSAPLLASSSTARFSAKRNLGSKHENGKMLSYPGHFLALVAARLPLAFGIFMGGILLILIGLSFARPDALQKYIGAEAPVTTATHSTNSETNLHLPSTLNHSSVPLSPEKYLSECRSKNQGYMSHGDYWEVTPGVGSNAPQTPEIQVEGHLGYCSSSITYMLDGKVGLGADLALIAQVASFARERNRTFFVDDTYWDRGKWQDHFEDVAKLQPGPEPGCKAPPAEQLLACPRTSTHWIINSRTAKFHFGDPFYNHYEDAYAHNLNRLRPIFQAASESLNKTIRPNEQNMELIELARNEMATVLQDAVQRKAARGLEYMATQIRRGERKSLSYLFPGRKIPVRNYLDAVKSTWARISTARSSDASPVVYLSTDSPEVLQEFTQTYEGEIFSLFISAHPKLRNLASQGEYYQAKFDEMDVESRMLATRGMIVDIAMVSGIWAEKKDVAPEAIVCALSSNVCKLAPMGFGWEKAFGRVDQMGYIDAKRMRWVDVDEKGQVIPVWRPFELFN